MLCNHEGPLLTESHTAEPVISAVETVIDNGSRPPAP